MSLRELSVEAQEWGLRVSDPVSKFLDKFAEGLSEPRRAAVAKIADLLEDDFGRVTIGGFADLYLHDVQRLVTAGGGGKGWAIMFEHYLGFKFKPLPQRGQVPDSAKLVAGSGEAAVHSTEARFKKDKLGAYLKRTGQLNSLVIPESIIEGAVTETVYGHPLTSNDKKAVVRAVCLWIITQYNFVGGCCILFDHLERQLHRKYPRYSGKPWKRSLALFMQNVRRPNATVGLLL
jgi:hypothetical protein